MATKKKAAPKRGASRYQAPAKKPVPGWIWLAAGLAIGVFVMLLMKLEPGRDAIKREKPETAMRTPGKPANSPATTPTPTPQPAKPKYDFYTLLPESEVIVPPDAVPEQTPPPPTPQELAKADAARAEAALKGETPPPLPTAVKAASTQYFLQAGIHAVPAIILERRHLVSGGQPPEVFEQALRHAAAEKRGAG